MLEYWKNEAKTNEEMLTKSNQVIRRNAQIEKLFNTLKSIRIKNLLKHFLTFKANGILAAATKVEGRQRRITINGKKIIQRVGSTQGSYSSNKEKEVDLNETVN